MNPDLKKQQRLGYLYGIIAVILFSINFAAMKLAVRDMSPIVVGLGRSLFAAIPAGILLLALRRPFPKRRHLPALLITTGGAVVGFPILLAMALTEKTAAHAAIVVGLMPLFTAIIGSWRDKEKQSLIFWFAALLGSATVAAYAYSVDGADLLSVSNLALLASVLCGSIGYAEGARLARSIGAPATIGWALLLAFPILCYPVIQDVRATGIHAQWQSWAGFLYAGTGSLLVGYLLWYKGLAMGGIAKVSQIQLVQPFLALASCGLLLGEALTLPMLYCSVVVVLCIITTKRVKPAAIPLEERHP